MIIFYYYFVSPFYSAIVRRETIIGRQKNVKILIESLSLFFISLEMGEKWFYYRWSGCHFLFLPPQEICCWFSIFSLRCSSSINFAQRWKTSSPHIFVYNNIKEWNFWCVWRRTLLAASVKIRAREKNHLWTERESRWKFLCDVLIYFSRSKRRVKFVFFFDEKPLLYTLPIV